MLRIPRLSQMDENLTARFVMPVVMENVFAVFTRIPDELWQNVVSSLTLLVLSMKHAGNLPMTSSQS